jgi:hypothetical protein
MRQKIMRNAGLDFYAYRGRHRQSLEMAIEYCASLAKGAGFYATVTAENCGSCPNAPQYYGKIVNGVDPNVVIGAYRFPQNTLIAGVEAAAKTASSWGPFTLDAIFFGQWRN